MTVEIGKEKSIRVEFFLNTKKDFLLQCLFTFSFDINRILILLLQEKITNTYSTLE
jgi:hypothetical protein